MDFLKKLKSLTKKKIRGEYVKNGYLVFNQVSEKDDLLLSDIDGWFLTMLDCNNNFTAPFSVKIDDKFKVDEILDDGSLKKYYNETLLSKMQNMVYKSKNLEKSINYTILCLGCYFKFGFKIFDPPLFVGDVKFEKFEKKGGDNDEKKKMAKND